MKLKIVSSLSRKLEETKGVPLEVERFIYLLIDNSIGGYR
jgi:hypothetical protein